MSKKRNREDIEDRCIAYRDARWGLGLRDDDNQSTPPRCVQDIDQLEYTVVDGEIVYVAILEITRRDKHPTIKNPPKSYFESILARYDKDFQGRCAVQTAKVLGCEAFCVVFDEDMKRLWVYNLSQGFGFNKELSREQYFKWLRNKHETAIKKHKELIK